MSPIEILEKFNPRFQLSGLKSKVFGCISYVHLNSVQIDKLSARALNKCLWVTQTLQKGVIVIITEL